MNVCVAGLFKSHVTGTRVSAPSPAEPDACTYVAQRMSQKQGKGEERNVSPVHAASTQGSAYVC